MAGSVTEREAACVVIGLHNGKFHLTIAENGGGVTAWVMDPDKFDSMMMRAHEASISYRVKILRERAAERLEKRKLELPAGFIGQMDE
jgi:PHD/YefM family antitoxin component YafN of YafNO toxin-antitoxin module